MTGSRNVKQIPKLSDCPFRKEEEVTTHFNKLTTRLEALKGSNDHAHFTELHKPKEPKHNTPISPHEFASTRPVVGISTDNTSEGWSEVPACPVPDYSQIWSDTIEKFVKREELNKAIGFWMNIKKPSESLHCAFTKLQENIGTNEVLMKPQTPSTPPLDATDPPDTPIDSKVENDLANTIPVDIGKSIKKFFPVTLESKYVRTPQSIKAREASTTRTTNARTNKQRRRASRSGKSLHRLRSRRVPTASQSPPRSPASSYRESRQQVAQQVAHHLAQHQPAPQQAQSPSSCPSASQRSRRKHSRSSRRLGRSALAARRASQHQTRQTPLRSGRSSAHKMGSRISTSARYLGSPSTMPLAEVSKFKMRTYASCRPHHSKTRRTTSPGNNLRPSSSFFGLSRNQLEPQVKNHVKKKKKNRPKSPSINRSKTSPSQISRVCPLVDFPRSRNAFQQTDNNSTSTSIQANLLPQELIELFMDDSKTNPVTKFDTTSQGTQTILTSEHKCVTVLVSNNVENLKLKPLLMSRTAQTPPLVRSTKVATRNFRNGRFTDSEISLYNSQMSTDKPSKKFCKVLTRPPQMKPKISSTTSAVSSIATDSKKLESRQSSFTRFTHWSRGSLFDPKPRMQKLMRVKMSDTILTAGDLKDDNSLQSCTLLSETKSDNSEESFDFMDDKGRIDLVPAASNKKECKVVHTLGKKCLAKLKTPVEISPKLSNITSTDLDTLATKTSQIPVSSLPSDRESPLEGKLSRYNVCENSFNRFVNRMRAAHLQFPQTKTTQSISNERELVRRDPTKPVCKYGTLSQPALHLAKGKVISSTNLKSNFSFNSKIKSKTNQPKSSKASEVSSENDSKTSVKKNINMLVEACQNLLSEAMKESKGPLQSNISRDQFKENLQPTTQETVAWILRTLKNTYGNAEPPSETNENEYTAAIEQKCQTCPKITEVLAPTQQNHQSLEVSSDQDTFGTSIRSPICSPCKLSNINVSRKESYTEDNETKCVANASSSSMDKTLPTDKSSPPCVVLSTSPLKSEEFENKLLHLNYENLSAALRQVQNYSAKALGDVAVLDNLSNVVSADATCSSTEDSFNVLSKSSINMSPHRLSYSEIAEATPVTKVSLWSKTQEANTSLIEVTEIKSDGLQNDTVQNISNSTDISSSILKNLFEEDKILGNLSDNNIKGNSTVCDTYNLQ